MGRIIFGIIGTGLAVGIFMFYTKGAYDGIQSEQEKVAQYDQALAKAAELQQLKSQLLSKFNAFTPEEKDRLHKLLPDHVDNVGLILDFDNLASHYNMPLANVDVSTPSSQATTQGSISSIGGGGQKYDSLTLKFSTQGTYSSFITFMHGLESSLRVVDLISLSITRNTTPVLVSPVVAAEPVFNYDVTLRTYWLK